MKTSKTDHVLPEHPLDATEIVNAVMQHDRRVLLFGPMGVGTSTLAAQLAQVLSAARRQCCCLSADPGSPAFGIPGTVRSRWGR